MSHVWLVDPAARTLEVYQRVKRGWLLTGSYEDDALVRPTPSRPRHWSWARLWLPEGAEKPSLLVAVP
ncbi:Uma2 family endonuclease [Myxococcus xanthus]|uniref:Uma2 family endonuclease n=1 Tax=Myxococcus xanthus TaxID=34 RepID=UPI0021E56A27|nr:Uma2 family endonuclease [Myxococcus xanthus]UYI25980.1 Uma2 family endonuclease [Myxococcus xanthus]